MKDCKTFIASAPARSEISLKIRKEAFQIFKPEPRQRNSKINIDIDRRTEKLFRCFYICFRFQIHLLMLFSNFSGKNESLFCSFTAAFMERGFANMRVFDNQQNNSLLTRDQYYKATADFKVVLT